MKNTANRWMPNSRDVRLLAVVAGKDPKTVRRVYAGDQEVREETLEHVAAAARAAGLPLPPNMPPSAA